MKTTADFNKIAALTPKIKVGDMLWMGTYDEPKKWTGVVTRITSTQIVVSETIRGYERKFYIQQGLHFRAAGVEVGTSHMFRPYYITGYATPADIREAKRQELSKGFSEPTWVSERTFDTSDKTPKYSIENLSERQVRLISFLLTRHAHLEAQ